MLILGIGVLLTSGLLAQERLAAPGWQSMRIVQTADPVFPPGQLQAGVTEGEARLVINTDADGRLADYLIIGYTDRDFASAAVAAVKEWTFVPAQLDGTPVGTTVELHFSFQAKGVVVSTSNPFALLDAQLRRMLDGRLVYQPCQPAKLDAEPKALVTVAPAYPAQLAKQGLRGAVTLDFFIDETGAVRLACGVSTDNNQLTALALEALRQWKFTPPTSNGRAVMVRARQLFRFQPGMDASAG